MSELSNSRKGVLVLTPESGEGDWAIVEMRADTEWRKFMPGPDFSRGGDRSETFATLDEALKAAREVLSIMSWGALPDIRDDFGQYLRAYLAEAESRGLESSAVLSTLIDSLDSRRDSLESPDR